MRQYQGCALKKLKGGQCSELVKSRAAYDCYASHPRTIITRSMGHWALLKHSLEYYSAENKINMQNLPTSATDLKLL